LKNREKALSVLQAKVGELYEREAAKKFSGEKKLQLGTGDRSEKIRTYNVLQDRITDHRLKESWHGISLMLGQGQIGKMMDRIVEYFENGGEAGTDEDEG